MNSMIILALVVVLGVSVSEACQCTDIRPVSAPEFSCAEQATFGKCDKDYVQGYCNLSCNRCGDKCNCVDRAPQNTTFTCPEFAAFGGCSRPWMRDGFYCAISCGFCNAETGEVYAEGIEEIVPDVALNFGASDGSTVAVESAPVDVEEAPEVEAPKTKKNNKKNKKNSKKNNKKATKAAEPVVEA
eukprot:TRINITY_DN3927_c0_g1_i3.p2 TRINITY_DN3927_c0_g1~~TRINITY_DN3927_c0_g1_i3.p2  ORF type:complete len:186 (-),score=47.89 TRINITY_DN3927_c0_g1_i3:271-828(-)